MLKKGGCAVGTYLCATNRSESMAIPGKEAVHSDHLRKRRKANLALAQARGRC